LKIILEISEENMNSNFVLFPKQTRELYKDNVKTEMITNLEVGWSAFCDHDTFTGYVVEDISRIPVSSNG
jgi:hypothetical protein